ncbi:MAG TPA: response regulator [Alphaproteobacteria bacterium]|jgi:DNA-binding response OmpR family regulator
MARILVADDERAVREFVRRALVHWGHEVSVAEDGESALTALGAGNFDLLLTDIVMPGMDGIALAQWAAAKRPGLPILLMSGYAAERQRAHNLEALDHKIIPKPFTLREIGQAVNAALAAGTGS